VAQPSETLMDTVFFALDHGVDSVRGGGSLVPFLVTEGAERKLERFLTERLEEGLAKAHVAASSLDSAVRAYAIAHDGYVTIEGTKFDAIIVEAGERGGPAAFMFAQRYKPKKGAFGSLKTVGNPAFLGESEQRLR